MLQEQLSEKSKPLKTVTGPEGGRILGVALRMKNDPLELIIEAAQEHGGLARLDLGVKVAYLVTGPTCIKHVLQDKYRNYIRGKSVSAGRLLLGNGLALSDGAFWLRQRRLMQPAFHRRRLEQLVAVVTETVAAKVEAWRMHASSDQPLDIASEMNRLTLTVIIKAMFSTDMTDKLDVMEKAFDVGQEFLNTRRSHRISLPKWFPSPAQRRFDRAKKTLDDIIYELLDQRRSNPGDKGDLLSMLLAARDEETGEGMSDLELRDEIMTTFFAGHETTTSVLTWIWYLLDQHPEVDARMRAEIDEVLDGKQPTFEDLAKLTYTEMVFHEAMRLYTPVWMHSREAVEADVIDGYPIPAGQLLLISPYVTHHDPRWWPDPWKFDPERFTPEAKARQPNYTYIPFGGGPHLCIGNNFSIMESKIILVLASQAFRLRLTPNYKVEVTAGVTTRPRGGLPMTLHSV